MSLESRGWIRRLKTVEHEFRVAHLALSRLAEQARHDPTILDSDMRYRTIGEALSDLNATYAIRLFAEFETGLRQFWVKTRSEPEPSRVAEAIDRVAARQRISPAHLQNCHRVRQYRNRQVHDSEEAGETLEVSECRGILCTFLGKLPLDWISSAP